MPKRILLADDSITIQKVVELTFSDGDYEVTAVNNGAKAIQKLAEMRPDVILSDIIMPEKNGYEVCEYVKSHPEYRTIPVVLLTGTFEPFDPDRADKAGCDAVVTKPFESQSLIHKVEELIQHARSEEKTAPQQAMPASEQLTTGVFTPAADIPELQEHGSDIFGSAAPAPEGETRAYSSMSFEELQRMAGETPAPPPPQVPPAPEASPWDEAPAPAGGETRAFPSINFDELQRMAGAAPPPPPPPAPPAAAAPPPPPEPSPWDEPAPPPPAPTGAETRAFPSINFDEVQRMTTQPPTEPSPWDEPAAAAQPFDTTPPPVVPPTPEPSPWDEGTDIGGETRSFSRMTFEELERMATAGAPMPPVAEPEPEPELTPLPEAEPVEEASPEHELPPLHETPVEHEIIAPTIEVTPEPEPVAAYAPEPEPAPVPVAATSADLTDEQVDRIARRVVQLMSDQVVRNIAWEVIPDMAEMVVKERIRQLENE